MVALPTTLAVAAPRGLGEVEVAVEDPCEGWIGVVGVREDKGEFEAGVTEKGRGQISRCTAITPLIIYSGKMSPPGTLNRQAPNEGRNPYNVQPMKSLILSIRGTMHVPKQLSCQPYELRDSLPGGIEENVNATTYTIRRTSWYGAGGGVGR